MVLLRPLGAMRRMAAGGQTWGGGRGGPSQSPRRGAQESSLALTPELRDSTELFPLANRIRQLKGAEFRVEILGHGVEGRVETGFGKGFAVWDAKKASLLCPWGKLQQGRLCYPETGVGVLWGPISSALIPFCLSS